MEEHNIDPVYDEFSKILILGSFPSVKSRESGFFYGHPRNRFWLVTASVFEDNIPCTINEKKAEELYNRYILNDVGIKAVCLPSTSPANAAWNNEKLIQAWKKIIMGGSIIEAK